MKILKKKKEKIILYNKYYVYTHKKYTNILHLYTNNKHYLLSILTFNVVVADQNCASRCSDSFSAAGRVLFISCKVFRERLPRSYITWK